MAAASTVRRHPRMVVLDEWKAEHPEQVAELVKEAHAGGFHAPMYVYSHFYTHVMFNADLPYRWRIQQLDILLSAVEAARTKLEAAADAASAARSEFEAACLAMDNADTSAIGDAGDELAE